MVRGMLNGRVNIEYRARDEGAAASNLHYQFSPYTFNPRIAQKVMRTSYVDLGQGLLDLIEQIYRAGDTERDHERV